MVTRARAAWAALILTNVASLCVLSLYQTTSAQQREDNIPFANAVEQRFEMITQLKEMNLQLKELNALLKSGKVRVTIEKK